MKKKVLGAVFSLALLGRKSTVAEVAKYLGVDGMHARKDLGRLRKKGLLETAGEAYVLTRRGRGELRVVFIGGGFEVIHLGHLHTIERAKALGDVLVVSVARDSTIRKRKGRNPVTGERDRARLLSSLRLVDASLLGVEGDIYETLDKVRPDVVALGYDQHHGESEVMAEAARRGMKLKVVRLGSPYPKLKTSRLLKEF